MNKILELLTRNRRRKPKTPPLLRSYLSFYNGQMETVAGRYFLRNNETADR